LAYACVSAVATVCSVTKRRWRPRAVRAALGDERGDPALTLGERIPRGRVSTELTPKEKPPICGGLLELAGLEPATSWVRSRFKRARLLHGSSSHFTNHRISRDFRAIMKRRLHSASRPIALHLCQESVTSSFSLVNKVIVPLLSEGGLSVPEVAGSSPSLPFLEVPANRHSMLSR
jgi:hypothetical protein